MDLSLREIFDRARAAQEWVPPTEADLLFAAALRKSVEMGVPLLPARVMLREGGVLELSLQDLGPEPEEYRAPEVAAGDPRRVDARAQVYTAGAVGYELFTGLPPPRAPHGPGPELTGPLGDVVRVAMAQDRRERFSDLSQLYEAVSTIEPHRSAPEERGLLAALLARVKRWEERAQNAAALAMLRHEHQTVEARLKVQEQLTAKLSAREPLSDRVAVLESSLQAVRAEGIAGIARLTQNLRELVEDKRREEAAERERNETREALAALHPPRPPLGSVLLAAALAAVLASVATVFVFEKVREAAPAAAKSAAIPVPDSTPPATPPAPANSAAPEGTPPPQASDHPPANPPPAPPAENVAAPAMATPNVGTPNIGTPNIGTPTTSPTTAPLAPAAAAAEVHPSLPSNPAPEAKTLPPAPGAAPVTPANHPAPPAPAPATAELTPKKRARQLLDRGDTALEKGHPDAAVAAFQSALNVDGALAEAHRGLGMAYAIKGDDDQAKKEYQLYLGAMPNAEDAADIRAAINELNTRSRLSP